MKGNNALTSVTVDFRDLMKGTMVSESGDWIVRVALVDSRRTARKCSRTCWGEDPVIKA